MVEVEACLAWTGAEGGGESAGLAEKLITGAGVD